MKRIGSYLILTFIVVAVAAATANAGVTINVPGPYGPTIQAAIDNATAGDTIVVAAGVFKETVTISKSNIILLGAQAGVDPRFGARFEGGPGETIIDGEGTRTEGILIQGVSKDARVANVVIDGFEVYRPTYAGIRFDFTSSVTLKNTMVHHCTTNEGIKTKGDSNDLLIQKVISHNNAGDGIEIGDYGEHARPVIEDSEIFDNEDRGIYLYVVTQATVRRTRIYGNKGTVGDWHQGGLIAYGCESNTYADLEVFSNVGSGIHLYKENYDGTTSSTMSGTSKVYNNLSYSGQTPGDGIRIYLSSNISIQGTECYGNARHGICVGSVGRYGNYDEPWGNVVLAGNRFHNNMGTGIKFEGGRTTTGLGCAATCNKIENNIGYGLNNAAINPIVATDNWWGAPTGPGAPGGPGSGDEISANATFFPWLTGKDISVTPAVLSFPDTIVNGTANLEVTITNAAACVFDLQITAINLASGEFTIVGGGTPPASLAPGETHTVTVRFKPASIGLKTADLSIESDAPGKSPWNVSLQGAGIGPVIQASPQSLTFADTTVGSTNGPQAITISNAGTTDLTATAALIGPGFTMTNGGAFTIAPSGSRVVSITFAPAAVGPNAAQIQITHNDPSQGPRSIALGGTGLPMAVSTFAVEEAKIDWKKKDADDKIMIRGTFNLPPGANPDPTNMLLRVNELTFNASAMTVKADDKRWEYKRIKGATGIKDMKIEWKKKEATFEIHIDDAAVPGWTNLNVYIALRLGAYEGFQTVLMKEHKDSKWQFPK